MTFFSPTKMQLSALISGVKATDSFQPRTTDYFSYGETKLAFVLWFWETALSCHVHVKLIRRKY